jgi:hypothetical protein
MQENHMKRMLGLMAGVVLSLSFLGCGKTAAVQQTKGPLPDKKSFWSYFECCFGCNY